MKRKFQNETKFWNQIEDCFFSNENELCGIDEGCLEVLDEYICESTFGLRVFIEACLSTKYFADPSTEGERYKKYVYIRISEYLLKNMNHTIPPMNFLGFGNEFTYIKECINQIGGMDENLINQLTYYYGNIEFNKQILSETETMHSGVAIDENENEIFLINPTNTYLKMRPNHDLNGFNQTNISMFETLMMNKSQLFISISKNLSNIISYYQTKNANERHNEILIFLQKITSQCSKTKLISISSTSLERSSADLNQSDIFSAKRYRSYHDIQCEEEFLSRYHHKLCADGVLHHAEALRDWSSFLHNYHEDFDGLYRKWSLNVQQLRSESLINHLSKKRKVDRIMVEHDESYRKMLKVFFAPPVPVTIHHPASWGIGDRPSFKLLPSSSLVSGKNSLQDDHATALISVTSSATTASQNSIESNGCKRKEVIAVIKTFDNIHPASIASQSRPSGQLLDVSNPMKINEALTTSQDNHINSNAPNDDISTSISSISSVSAQLHESAKNQTLINKDDNQIENKFPVSSEKNGLDDMDFFISVLETELSEEEAMNVNRLCTIREKVRRGRGIISAKRVRKQLEDVYWSVVYANEPKYTDRITYTRQSRSGRDLQRSNENRSGGSNGQCSDLENGIHPRDPNTAVDSLAFAKQLNKKRKMDERCREEIRQFIDQSTSISPAVHGEVSSSLPNYLYDTISSSSGLTQQVDKDDSIVYRFGNCRTEHVQYSQFIFNLKVGQIVQAYSPTECNWQKVKVVKVFKSHGLIRFIKVVPMVHETVRTCVGWTAAAESCMVVPLDAKINNNRMIEVNKKSKQIKMNDNGKNGHTGVTSEERLDDNHGSQTTGWKCQDVSVPSPHLQNTSPQVSSRNHRTGKSDESSSNSSSTGRISIGQLFEGLPILHIDKKIASQSFGETVSDEHSRGFSNRSDAQQPLPVNIPSNSLFYIQDCIGKMLNAKKSNQSSSIVQETNESKQETVNLPSDPRLRRALSH